MQCPRCQRTVYKDYDDDYYCITCGYVDPLHPRREAPRVKKKHQPKKKQSRYI